MPSQTKGTANMQLLRCITSLEIVDSYCELILISIVSVLVVVFVLTYRPTSLPPGPPAWPVIGSIPYFFTQAKLGLQPYQIILGLQKKYGNIAHFKMGRHSQVIISGYDLAKEALLKGDNLPSRPSDKMLFSGRDNRKFGIVWANGKKWKDARRFTLGSMRDFGVGKASLESQIQEECSYLIQELDQQAAAPYNVKTVMTNAVSNVICSVVFGKRYEYSDKTFNHTLYIMTRQLSKIAQGRQSLATFMPWLTKLPEAMQSFIPSLKLFKELKSLEEEIKNFVRNEIKEHRTTYNEENIRDFIDLYVQNEDMTLEEKQFDIDENNFFQIILELFVAGTDTTSTTLQWALLYMLTYPDIQTKVHQELDAIVGRGRKPGMSDKAKLPYTNAVIHEIQRCANIAPMSLPKTNSEVIHINGYIIPKDSIIQFNLRSVNMDPKYWKNPEEFNPNRWLNEQGMFENKSAFMPFGLGRRVCLGEQLARMELFLFFTALLQFFNFKLPKNHTHPGFEGVQGLAVGPKDYELIAEKR